MDVNDIGDGKVYGVSTTIKEVGSDGTQFIHEYDVFT